MATKALPGYFACSLPTPEKFKGIIQGGKALVIGAGDSTKKIIGQDAKLRQKFDKIICLNYTFREFDDVSDFHITVERQKSTDPITVPGALNAGKYRQDIPRLVNWQGSELYGNKYNLFKTTRSNFYFKPNIREYKYNNSEGLLYWKQKSRGWSSGTAALSGMHFATILGADEVYLIGCDLCFKSEFDHYYKDKVYRDPNHYKKVQPKHRMDIVDAELNGQKIKTTNLFRDAAETMDEVIVSVFGAVKIFDFSHGLIKKAIKLDVMAFLND